jgi:glutathione peroxidase
MKKSIAALGVCAVVSGAFLLRAEDKPAASPLSFKMKDIDGKEVDLSSYKGKVLLFVNVASQCGLTEKQYGSLTKLHDQYKSKGFEILAFPANNFGKQEPGTDKEIKEFCGTKNVAFKLFSKISVKGDDIHPLYKYLTSKETDPKFAGDIRWNFDKFLVDTKGNVIGRFEPKADPTGKEVTEAIDKALKEKK